MALSTTALITVAQAGAHLKLDATRITDDTDLLESIIAAATQVAEDYTERVFITRTITETHVGSGQVHLALRKWPATDITSITVNGTSLDSSAWSERLTIGRVYYASVWEAATIGSYVWELDAEIVVVYTAGYGTDRTVVQGLVPQAVQAVKLIVGRMYENRIDGVGGEQVAGLGSVSYQSGMSGEQMPSLAREFLFPLKIGILC